MKKTALVFTLFFLLVGFGAVPQVVNAGSEPFIGEIAMFAGNFAPRGWALCDGQILPIAQYSALFSLLGTTYGGDGRTTFALPDLRGRAPIHAGQGPGLSNHPLGQKAGVENVTLTTAQVPSHQHPFHNHDLMGSTTQASATSPEGMLPGKPSRARLYSPTGSNNVMMDTDAISEHQDDAIGGGQSHENMPPYLTINYIIALQGLFPSRN